MREGAEALDCWATVWGNDDEAKAGDSFEDLLVSCCRLGVNAANKSAVSK
jgi:hypothetical protein